MKDLQSVDCKKEKQNLAVEMATDVSKPLGFACNSAIQPDFEGLLDCDMLLV